MLDIHTQSLCQRGKLFSFLSWDLKVKLEVQHKMLLRCTYYFVIFIVLKSPEFRKQSLWNSNFSGGGPPDPPLWFWNPPYFWGLRSQGWQVYKTTTFEGISSNRAFNKTWCTQHKRAVMGPVWAKMPGPIFCPSPAIVIQQSNYTKLK